MLVLSLMLRFINQRSSPTRSSNQSYRVDKDRTWKERRDISAHLRRSASYPSAKFALRGRCSVSGFHHHDQNVGIRVQASAHTL